MALLGAMVLLALSAALVTGTFSAARALRRAALLRRAQARVETGVQRAFGEVLAQWSPALDSLPVASGIDLPLDVEPPDAGPPLVRRAHVQHVTDRLFAVTADVRAFGWDHPLAQRRARLWLTRAEVTEGAPTSLVPVTPWPFADLY